MTDEKVLAIATGAFKRAEALPVRSVTRQVQWTIFDSAMAELTRRAMLHVLQKIHTRDQGERQ
jgi:L-aminopeptidase/D-esterase-like protein